MSAGDCPRCNAWDDDLEYRDGICESCYIEDKKLAFANLRKLDEEFEDMT